MAEVGLPSELTGEYELVSPVSPQRVITVKICGPFTQMVKVNSM